MYNERVQGVLAQHEPTTPLFLYLAAQDAHGPDQTLPQWSSLYNHSYTTGFAVYNGMASSIDSLAANLTAALNAKGMWQDVLLVFSSDNGGPSELGKECNASNFPLRGCVTTVALAQQASRALIYDAVTRVASSAQLLCPHRRRVREPDTAVPLNVPQRQVVSVGRWPPCRRLRLWWISAAEHEGPATGWLHSRG